MLHGTDILNELRDISPLLAGISPENVYQAPSGYFDHLSAEVLGRIQEPYDDSVVIVTEELEISLRIEEPEARDLPLSHPPSGYFEGFADQLMARIKGGASQENTTEPEVIFPLLNSIDKKMPFSVPYNYFEGLPEDLAALAIFSGKADTLSPLMEGLKQEPAYQVPAGYFDRFSDHVLTRLKKQAGPEARLVSMPRKRVNWIRLAAAAMVIGVIGTASILFLQQNRYYSDPIQGLSKLSDGDMINYLEEQSTPVVTTENSGSIAIQETGENEAKDLFSDIPDEDLQQYAQEQSPITAKDLITN